MEDVQEKKIDKKQRKKKGKSKRSKWL